MKKLRVTVDGKAYDVTVEILEGGAAPVAMAHTPVRPASIPAQPVSAPRPAAPVANGDGDVYSPLAGKVISIDVSVGQDVEEGDQLLTIEAMKMNTYVYAPHAGKVAEILVQGGNAVDQGQILVKLA